MRAMLAALVGALALAFVAPAVEPEYYQPPGKDYLVPVGKKDPLAIKADPPAEKFQRGLKKTPRHLLTKIATERPFRPAKGVQLPTSVAYVPAKTSYWLNNQYGDCVTAEEAFNQACLHSEVFITDATVKAWAGKYGFLNGAMLTDVMDQMARDGFHQDGNVYGVGSYQSVNFSDEATLQAALTIAPVKIGMDAAALPSGAGNKSGWWSSGGKAGQFDNEDHCTAFAGYGPPADMFKAVGATLPAGWPAKSTVAYLFYTWNTIGVVDHDWIMSCVSETYVRNPTATLNGKAQPNPGPGPNPPPPPPGPTPPPGPAPAGYTGTIATVETYKDGKVIDKTVVVGGTAGDIKSGLDGAGVSPLVVTDGLKLITDLMARPKDATQLMAWRLLIFGDLMKLMTDFTAAEPLQAELVPKSKDAEKGGKGKMSMLWRRKDPLGV